MGSWDTVVAGNTVACVSNGLADGDGVVASVAFTCPAGVVAIIAQVESDPLFRAWVEVDGVVLEHTIREFVGQLPSSTYWKLGHDVEAGEHTVAIRGEWASPVKARLEVRHG